MKSGKAKAKWKVYIPMAIIAAGVITAGIVMYINYSHYLRTDDAFITSNNISVSSKTLGRIARLYAEEGDSVVVGELLAELDSTDLLSQRKQTVAAKLQAEAAKLQAEAKLESDQKGISVLEIARDKASDDLQRARAQHAGGVITQEQFDHATSASRSAEAQLGAATAQLAVSKAQVNTAEASIAGAKAQIGVIDTQLDNMRLYAPATGIVAKRWLLPGDVVQPGQAVFTINDDSLFWVAVYLEETKMATVHVGQSAKFTVDTYPGVVFEGKVFMVSPTTASQFSLIPPNNASGNFTKVTQRIPLKISIERTSDGRPLTDFNLLTGMSAEVRIIK